MNRDGTGDHYRIEKHSAVALCAPSLDRNNLDYHGLHSLVLERIGGAERPYLFFDEIWEVAGWERAINALRVDVNCAIAKPAARVAPW